MDFSKIIINDYDKIPGLVDTELFTKLDGIEIVYENHPFIHFLRGMTFFIDPHFYKNIYHGYFHKDTATAKFLVNTNNVDHNNIQDIIMNSWRMFIEFDNADVIIYSRNYGQIYEMDYDHNDNNNKIFYKNYMKKIVCNLVDNI
jgi:hypothetical protein